MTPGRVVDPWEELEIDLCAIDTLSLPNDKRIVFTVDRTSRFPYGFRLPTKQAEVYLASSSNYG